MIRNKIVTSYFSARSQQMSRGYGLEQHHCMNKTAVRTCKVASWNACGYILYIRISPATT